MDEAEQNSNVPDPRLPLGQNFFSPAQSLDETPVRRTRPLSMLSYNPPTLPGTPSPANFNLHSRQPSLTSSRPLVQPSGTPSKRTTRWTLIVLPPALLPHSPPPPHVSGFAHGYGASGRYSAGLLLPLQPTLTLQLASIAREFSLPSTGGLTLHLSIPAANDVVQAGPRITDDSWVVLFGWAFEENPSNHCGLQPSTGLPIAARVEFDIDMRKARWFEAWASAAQPNMHRPSLTKLAPKLSTASVPLLRPRAQEAPSSTNTGVRTLMISASRRSSVKALGSSGLDDGSGTDRLPLVCDQEPHRARSTIAPSEVSLGSPPAERETHQLSCLETQPDQGTGNDRLERLTEEALTDGEIPPDSGQVEDAKWELQQYTLMKQAAIERERIELADLEEERRRQEVEMLEHDKLWAERQREEGKEAERAAAQARLLADQQASNELDQVVAPGRVASHQIEEPPTKAAEQQQPIQNANSKVNKTLHTAASGVAAVALAASGAAAVVISSPQTPPRDRRANTDVGADHQYSSKTPAEPGPPSSTFSTILGRSVGRFSGEQELMKRRSQTAQSSAAGKRQLEEMDKVVQEKALAKEATLLTSTRRAVSDDGLLSPVLVKEMPKTPPPLPTRSKVIELAKAFAAEERRSAGAGPSSSRQVSRSQERPTGLARSPKNADQSLGGAFEPTGLTSKSLPQTPAFTEVVFKTKGTQEEVPPSPSPSIPKELKAVVVKEPNSPQYSAYVEQTVVPAPDKADVQETSLSQVSPAEQASEAEVPHEIEWPRSPIFVTHTVEQTYETVDTEQVPLSQTSTVDSAFDSAGSEEIQLPRAPVYVEQTIEEIYETEDGPVADVLPMPSSDEHKQVERSSETETHSPLVVEQQQEQPLPVPADPIPPTPRDPLAPLLYTYDTDASLSEDLAEYIVRAQADALERHDKFVVAVSGGSLAKIMARGLLGHPNVKWDSWKVFFADERIVPLDSEDSNFGTMMSDLFSHVPIERNQIVSIMGLPPDDMDLDEMTPVISTIYEAQVLEELDLSATGGEGLPRFDLILLGMGDDGHTCSLFPSHRLLDQNEGVVNWLNDSPKPPAHRITLGLAVLNAAHDAAFVCTGSNKEAMLAAVLEQESSSVRPASLVKLGHRPVPWFVDEAAAASTCYPRLKSEIKAARAIQEDAPRLADGLDTSHLGPVGGAESLVRNDFGYPHNLSAIYMPMYPHLEGWLYRAVVPEVVLGPSCCSGVGYGVGLRETNVGRDTAQDKRLMIDECFKRTPPCSNLQQRSLAPEDDARGAHALTNAALAKANLEQEVDEASEDGHLARSTLSGAESVRNEFGYPYDLSAIYSPVYPFLERSLYRAMVPNAILAPCYSLHPLGMMSALDKHPAKLDEAQDLSALTADILLVPLPLDSYLNQPSFLLSTLDGSVEPILTDISCLNRSCLQTSGALERVSLPGQMNGGNLEQPVRMSETRYYPYNLRPYPGVYPHLEDALYCSALPTRLISPSLACVSLAVLHGTQSGLVAATDRGSLRGESGATARKAREEPCSELGAGDKWHDARLVNANAARSGLTSTGVTEASWSPTEPQAEEEALEQVVRSAFSYPFNLTVYPAVYPHVEEMLYLGPTCKRICLPSLTLARFRPRSQYHESCAIQPGQTKTTAHVASDSSASSQTVSTSRMFSSGAGSNGIVYPFNLCSIYPGLYPDFDLNLYPSFSFIAFDGAHHLHLDQPVIESASDFSVVTASEKDGVMMKDQSSLRSLRARSLGIDTSDSVHDVGHAEDDNCQPKHVPAPLQTFSGPDTTIGVAYQASGDANKTFATEAYPHVVQPISPEEATKLGPMYYPDDDALASGGVRAFEPSLQYSSLEVDQDEGARRGPAVGALALEMSKSNLSGAFYGKCEVDGLEEVKENLTIDERKVDEQQQVGTDDQSGLLSSQTSEEQDRSPIVVLYSSPIAILASTLTDSFYPDDHQALADTQQRAVRRYSPSVQYMTLPKQEAVGAGELLDGQRQDGGALGLDMQPSALSGAFFGQSEVEKSVVEDQRMTKDQIAVDEKSEEPTYQSPKMEEKFEEAEQQSGFLSSLVVKEQSRLGSQSSPVGILPTTSADPFHSDERQALTDVQVARASSPSLDYTPKVEADDGVSGSSLAVGALGLHMSASALSGAFLEKSGDVGTAAEDLVTKERTVDELAEPEDHQSDLLSSLPCKNEGSLPLHRSPVAILPATLAESFYPDDEQALVNGTKAVRGFSPSLQYTQKVGAEDGSHRPAVGALALYMPASALSGAFFGNGGDVKSTDEDFVTNERKVDQQAEPERQQSDFLSPLPFKDRSLAVLPSSPVAILPTTLADSFYPSEHQALAGSTKAVRGFSPSLQYAQIVGTEEARPTTEALALDMPASCLSGGFFGQSEALESTAEDLTRNEGQSSQRAENDRRSDSSPSLSSKVGSSSQSQWPSRQITDDEWPCTPPSPHKEPSTDLVGGLTLSPEQTTSVGLINRELEPEFLKREVIGGVVIREQSSTRQLIEQDNESGMTTMAEASLVTPIISQFHQALLNENDGGVRNPEGLEGLTPKANLCETLNSQALALDRSPSVEIEDQVCAPPLDKQEETVKYRQGVLDQSEYFSGLNVEIPKAMVEVDMQMAQVSLADASLITPSIEEFHRTGLTKDSHGRAVNQMRTLAEMDSIDMACEPASPGRLPSPSLMDRVTFTPGQTIAVLKQFPDYSGSLTMGNESGSQPADKIEVDRHTRQISLSDASQISPSLVATVDTNHSDVVSKSETGARAHSVQSESSDDDSPEPLPMGSENQMRSLKEMDSVDMVMEPASPARLASADLSGRLENDQVDGTENQSQFPAYGSYADSPQSSPAYIEADAMERRMSTAAAGEITPSIAKYHRAGSGDLLPVDEPTSPFFLHNKEEEDRGEIEESEEGQGESTIYAISTDHTEPGRVVKRQLSRSEHRTYSDRLSMIRSSSPSIPALNLAINFSDSHSGESTVETEEDGNGVSNVYDEAEQTPSEHSSFAPNGPELEVNRLNELTGQSVVTGSSEGSAGPGEAEGPWLVEPGRAISGEGLPIIATHPPTPFVIDELSVPEVVEGTMNEELPPPPPPILLPFPNEVEIGEALAQFVFEAQEAAFQRHGKFKVALGGSMMAQILGDGIVADDRIQWQYWEVFLVEEAIAPIGSADSTFSTLMNSILQHVPIPREQVHSIAELTKADVEEASGIATGMDSLTDSLADEYENTLLEHFPEASHETGQAPRFDLILVGLGEKGQVGSLYPSHPLLGEGDWFVAWLGDAPEGPGHRITLTLPVLNAAHQFAFVATGEKVAGMVAEALERSVQSDVPMEEDREVPAALVKTDRRPIVWFTDLEASSLTDYTKSAFWDE